MPSPPLAGDFTVAGHCAVLVGRVEALKILVTAVEQGVVGTQSRERVAILVIERVVDTLYELLVVTVVVIGSPPYDASNSTGSFSNVTA